MKYGGGSESHHLLHFSGSYNFKLSLLRLGYTFFCICTLSTRHCSLQLYKQHEFPLMIKHNIQFSVHDDNGIFTKAKVQKLIQMVGFCTESVIIQFHI